MADGLKKVQPGEPYEGFPAHVYNHLIDLIRQQAATLAIPQDNFKSGGVVKVRNNSGQNVIHLGVLGIDAPLVLPSADANEFRYNDRLDCIDPTTAHANKFVVLQNPLNDGEVGWAMKDGVTAVKINVQSADHEYAYCAPSTRDYLVSCGAPTVARILWKESGTGEKWALIHLHGEPLSAIVRVLGDPCENIDQTAPQLWDGVVMQYVEGSGWVDGPACWIKISTRCPIQLEMLPGSDRFLAHKLDSEYNYAGTKRALYGIQPETGTVRVNAEDKLDFLEDQFIDHEDPTRYTEGDLIAEFATVYDATNAGSSMSAGMPWNPVLPEADGGVDAGDAAQTGFVFGGEVQGGDPKLKSYVNVTGYNSNEQVLVHPNGSPDPEWWDIETLDVITDLRLYSGPSIQKRVYEIKVLAKTDKGWSEALPATEC